MKTPLQYFSTRRLPAWQGELEFLQRSFVCEPDAVQAWWWRIRLRVLAFVIVRYGANPAVRARDHAAEPPKSSGDFLFGKRRMGAPRPRETFGVHLQGIAEANDFPGLRLPPDDYPRLRETNSKANPRRIAILTAIVIVLACWLAFETLPKWYFPITRFAASFFSRE